MQRADSNQPGFLIEIIWSTAIRNPAPAWVRKRRHHFWGLLTMNPDEARIWKTQRGAERWIDERPESSMHYTIVAM